MTAFLIRRTGERPAVLLVLAAIFFLGLFLRVTAVSESVVWNPVRGDAKAYFSYGANLQAEGIYSESLPRLLGGAPPKPDAAVPPVYPLFVAALMTPEWRTGTAAGVYRSIVPVINAQAWLGSMLVLLVFFLARRVANPGIALVAALLTAASPHLVNVNIYLLTECLFSVLFWAAMLLLARDSGPDPGLRTALLAGLVLAMAALTRPTVQYLALPLAAAGMLATRSNRRRWLLFLAAFAVPLMAWGLRNLAVLGTFSDPTAMTATIQVGGYPDFMYNGMPQSRGIPYRFDPVLTDFSSLGRALAVIKQRFLAAPATYLEWYLVGKPAMFFHWDILPIGTSDARLLVDGDIYIYPTPATPYASNPLFIVSYLLCRILYLPGLLAAAVASVLTWVPRLRPFWGEALATMRILSLTLFYVLAIHMIGSPFPRYSIPFQPLTYLLAAGLLAALWRARRPRRGAIEDGARVL